jgi:hypothetical protein
MELSPRNILPCVTSSLISTLLHLTLHELLVTIRIIKEKREHKEIIAWISLFICPSEYEGQEGINWSIMLINITLYEGPHLFEQIQHKYHRLNSINNIVFSKTWMLGTPRSRCWHIQCLVKTCFRVVDCFLLAVFLHSWRSLESTLGSLL